MYTAAFNGQNVLLQFFGCYVVFMTMFICNLNNELVPKQKKAYTEIMCKLDYVQAWLQKQTRCEIFSLMHSQIILSYHVLSLEVH